MYRLLTDADRRQGMDPLAEAGLGVEDPLVRLEQAEELEPMTPDEEVSRFWLPIVGFTCIAFGVVVACCRG